MVLLKRAIRQRARALRLFSTALLSCGYSPGLEESWSGSESDSHCELILAVYPISHSVQFLNLMTKTDVCILCEYNNCGDVYCYVIQLTIDPNSLKHSLLYRKM